MKLKRMLSLILCFAILSGFAVFGSTQAFADSSFKRIHVKLGDTYKLFVDENTPWQMTNPKIVSIDAWGVVHAHALGEASVIYHQQTYPYTYCEYCFVVEDYMLSKTSLTMTVGESETLTLDNRTGVVDWKSKNKKVATVSSNGTVKAVGEGSTKIVAKYGGANYTCSVKVKAKPLSLSKKKLTLTEGKKAALRLRNATSKVTWSSSNTKVATVSSKGVVTAKKAGKATITAKHKKKSYKCVLTVKALPVSLSKTKAALTAGGKLTLKLKNAKGAVKWSSSNKKVASVSSKGVVKALKKGTATISAKYKGKTYKCKLTVKAKPVTVKTAMNKLKNYLVKNGTPDKDYKGDIWGYTITVKQGDYTYNYAYWFKENAFVINRLNNSDSLGDKDVRCVKLDIYIDKASAADFYSEFGKFDYRDGAVVCYGNAVGVKRSDCKSSQGIDFKLFKSTVGVSGSETEIDDPARELAANTALKECMKVWDSYIAENAGVTMAQLGFTNWKK